jgi:hypothetical protein
MTYDPQGKHANHYTTDAVLSTIKKFTLLDYVIKKFLLTITRLISQEYKNVGGGGGHLFLCQK